MPKKDSSGVVTINRAPVLTLWAVVVAERLGFDRDEALTLGKAVAGLSAYAKGKSLGIMKPASPEVKKKRAALRPKGATTVDLLHRAVPAIQTADGIRALHNEKPVDPASVQKSLASKFGDDLKAVEAAMTALAKSMPPATLADRAYGLYEEFRPHIPAGTKGWGAAGTLDLELVRSLGK